MSTVATAAPAFDIVVQASVSRVSAFPNSDRARTAGFEYMSAREEYSDTIRANVRAFAAQHGLTVDWSKDW